MSPVIVGLYFALYSPTEDDDAKQVILELGDKFGRAIRYDWFLKVETRFLE